MLPLIAVIAHPGRRLGTMIETVFLCSSGILLGNGHALLGRYLAQRAVGSNSDLPDKLLLVEDYNGYRAGLGILVVFEVIMLFVHGWLRSISHKFFPMAFQFFLVVHFAFTSNISTEAIVIFKSFTIPFFIGMGLSLACNLLLFPEFGSSYLGKSMIQTFNELHNTLDSTVQFFISIDGDDATQYNTKPLSLAQLTKKKSDLRTKLNTTLGVLHECTYEISYSYCSPDHLKTTLEIMNGQLSYINALINASQLQFKSLLGKTQQQQQQQGENNLPKEVLKRTRGPIHELQMTISQTLLLIKHAIGYSYDVSISEMSDSPIFNLKNVDLNETDFNIEISNFTKAMAQFDIMFREELKNLSSEYENYFAPNDDMFLLSSFLMNLREAANSVCNILKEAQKIYEYRKSREAKGMLGRKIWVLFLSSTDQMKKYLNFHKNSALIGAEIASLNGTYIRSENFIDDDLSLHTGQPPPSKTLDGDIEEAAKIPKLDKLLSSLSGFYEKNKAHFRFGFQITVALMLSSFPMFVPESREWFKEYRGTWIAFVCILVLEPEVGSTFFVFFLRGVGVIAGSAWGYLSYVAAINQTNPYLEVVVTAIGAVPGFYYFLGTPYVKAAIIGVISIYVVLLSTALPSEIGGSIAANFGKRCLAMLYGGLVALVCQLIFFPIKARDELVKEVAFSTGAISKLSLLYASGLDGENVLLSLSDERFEAFTKLLAQSKASLNRADAYRVTAKKEPRLKGSFDEISHIFFEVIFILREILDRVDNIVQLRRVYGSAIIEEFNTDVHPYRRQLSAAISNSLKMVQLALLTKTPLPQYLPSAKIAHKRLFEKVREVVEEKYHRDDGSFSDSGDDASEIFVTFKKRHETKPNTGNHHQEDLLKAKFLSWNATSAATEEVIDYIEELLELCKVLVGVHEFKYGFLSRTLYSDYAAKAARSYKDILQVQGTIDGRVFHSDNESDEEDAVDDDDGIDAYNENYNPVGIVNDARSQTSGISNGFRRRVYSIGSWINGGDMTSAKSLGEYSEEFDSDDESKEIPHSLMKVMSKKSGEAKQ
jgi:uncharacterized membrane protein YgaE (UPF0421/DUF939 family)